MAGLVLVCLLFAPVLLVLAEEKTAISGDQEASDPNSVQKQDKKPATAHDPNLAKPSLLENPNKLDSPKKQLQNPSDPNILIEEELAKEKTTNPGVATATDPNAVQKQDKKPATPPDLNLAKQSLPEDPNKIDSSNKESNNPSDPNALTEDEDDIFDIKVSTYVLINQAYEQIFTPKLITDDGRVEYARLKRLRHDFVAAKKHLKQLNPVVMWSLSEEQRMAFWINTYNFCMIDVILRNYPIKPKPSKPWNIIFYPDNSVMQIIGANKNIFFEIQQQEYNLIEIEKEFLLDRYKDPRICFALHNASIGGPLLRNEPYTAEHINEQLDEQVKKYLSLPDRGLKIDRENNIVHLSNLFRMKKDAFLNSTYAEIRKFRNRKDQERVWLNFIFPHLTDEDISYLENNDFKIKHIKYNWHLNEKK